MAWPPPTLPTTRTNTTVMTDTHPAEHNAVNLAINDIVTRISTAPPVAASTTNQGGFGTTPIAIATTLTFTAEAGRVYEIVASIPVAIGSGSTIALGSLIANGVATLATGSLPLPTNGSAGYLNLRWIGTLTAGSRTISFNLSANAGTVAHNAAPTQPSIISVNYRSG